MIVKQADLRANIKKFFDIAYEGEPVIVPRKLDKNIVIISEDEYNRLKSDIRTTSYAKRLSQTFKDGKSDRQMTGGNVRAHNMEKLEVIAKLKEGWNGNGAPSFSKGFIRDVKKLLEELAIQPEVFPTALGTIQLEYDNQRRDHMEIEIDGSDTAEVFIVNYDGEEIIESVAAVPEAINERAGAFYE